MLVLLTVLLLAFEFAGILFLASSNNSLSNYEVLLQTVKWFCFLLLFAPNLIVLLISIFAVRRDGKAVKNYNDGIREEDSNNTSDNNHRRSWLIVIVFLLIVMAISILYLKAVISAKMLVVCGAVGVVLAAGAIVLAENSRK